MAYVDKVIKEGSEYEIRDGRIGDVESLKTSIEGTSLVVPVPDHTDAPYVKEGIGYYNKVDIPANGFDEKRYDLLTGEEVSYGELDGRACLYTYYHGSRDTDLMVGSGTGYDWHYTQPLLRNGEVKFTSKAFLAVGSVSELQGDSTIVLPQCSRFYAELEPDGSVLHCYYNLGGEGPTVIDGVKQGGAVLPLRDNRIDSLPLGNKLYKHALTVSDYPTVSKISVDISSGQATSEEKSLHEGNKRLEFVTADATPYTKLPAIRDTSILSEIVIYADYDESNTVFSCGTSELYCMRFEGSTQTGNLTALSVYQFGWPQGGLEISDEVTEI